MANINKSFNFRNGVQVDNDNFVVNANGLVGIGTSIPRELLDVYGTAKITGLVTTTNLAVSGVSTFYSDVKVGSGITFVPSTGAVRATTFYGSAAGLTGFYAVATDGWSVNSAISGIFTSFSVGIGTTNPEYSFQIGQNPSNGNGFCVDSISANVRTTGIITAGYFSGNGSSLTSLNATNITSGTISNSYLPVINNNRLPSNINVSGIITATNGFNGSITGNITGNVYSTGVSTFSGGIAGNVTGNLTGTASTAQSLTGTPNITVGFVTASNVSASGSLNVTTSVNVGSSGTVFNVTSSGRIGIGTSVPTSDFQLRKSGTTLLEVLSDSGQASISIGQSVGLGKSTAVLRFGNTGKTFDIINNDTGNINQYLHAGPSGINTGRFDWYYGQNVSNPLMSLTYNGNLGIGKTNPETLLHVGGSSTVTGNAYFGNNVSIKGTLTVTNFNVQSTITNTDIYNTSGISTFYDLNIQRILNVTEPGSSIICSNIGIGTTNPIAAIDARTELLLIQSVGIGTTELYTDPDTLFTADIQLFDSSCSINSGTVILDQDSSIGFSTYSPRSILDFGNVGSSSTTAGYFITPTVSTSDRNQLTNYAGIGGTIEGAIIYNSTARRHQGYGSIDNGSTFNWFNLY